MNQTQQNQTNRTKWAVFTAATLGYGLFYVCRLSLNVVKKPIVDTGYLTETELGIIGSALFFSYAIGKFVNGFLADRVNDGRWTSHSYLGKCRTRICRTILGICHTLGSKRLVSVSRRAL